MLYVESANIVCDSETGEKFRVVDRYKFSYHGVEHDMSTVLGYVNGVQYYVSKILIELLEYIESITYVGNWGKAGISGLHIRGTIDERDTYNVIIRVDGWQYLSVLDMLLYASYDVYFGKCLESGCLNFLIGSSAICVKFCGNYIKYIGKLVSVYRQKWEGLVDIL